MSADDVVLSIKIKQDISEAMNAFKRMADAQSTMVEQMIKHLESLAQVQQDTTKEGLGQSKKVQKAKQEEIEQVRQLTDEVKALETQAKRLEKADTSEGIAAKRAIDRKLKALQDQIDLEEKLEGGEIMARSGGKDLGSAVSKAFKRDFKGALDDFGEALEKSMTGLEDRASSRGYKLSVRADQMKMAGQANMAQGRFIRGGLQQAGGAGMKGIGAIFKGLGPVFRMIGSLGPLLGAVSGAVVGLVKLFIDAHAQAKEFNATLLQGVGTAGFLARAGGNAGVAYAGLEETLDGIRKSAKSMDNMKWGISSEDHANFINSLTSEGYALDRFAVDAAKSGKTIEAFAGDLVHDAVTASRMLGTSVQEIGQYQAEMMADLGANVTDLDGAFTDLARSAASSGIATNKFFAMVRSVSADLSLYDARIGSAVRLLGKLGKVMSARNAQKFMQGLSQGLGGMDQDSRLKVALIAGEKKVRSIMTADFKRQSADLAGAASKALGITIEEAQSQMGSASGRSRLAASLSKANQGALSEGVMDFSINQQAMKAEGPWGLAAAMKGASMGASYDIQKEAITRFSGGKSVMEGIGTLGQDKIAQLLGISEEQVRGMAKLEMAMEGQKQSLIEQLSSTDEAQRAAALKQLQEAGVQASTAEEAKKLIESGQVNTSQLWQTISKEEQQSLEDAQKSQHDLAVEQVSLTDTLDKKIDRIMGFLMDQLYNILVDIWDGIMSIPGIGMSASDREAKRKAFKSGDATLIDAVSRGDTKGAMAGRISSAAQTIAAREGGSKTLFAAANHALSGDDMLRLADVGQLDAKKKDKLKEVLRGQSSRHGGGGLLDARRVYDFESAATKAGISPEEMAKMWEGMGWAADDKAHIVDMDQALQQALGKAAPASGQAPAAAKPPALPEAPAASAAASQDSRGRLARITDATPVQQATLEAGSLAADKLAELTGQNTAIETALRRKGIRMEKGFMTTDYYQMVKGATYEAFAKALFEYALYSKLDSGALLDMAKKPGFDASQAGAAYLASQQVPANASGGFVTGIAGGLAQVRAAPGEGLTSIGVGERIVPAGGAGNPVVSVTVNGIGGNDLARLIEAKVADGIYEYKRREGYTN